MTSKICTPNRRGLLILAFVSLSLSVGAMAHADQVGDVGAASEAGAAQPLNPCSPHGAKQNPCNPCGGSQNPCNPCGAGGNPCNPCGSNANPCNPCGSNPCNPCGGANPCNPCGGNPCNPCGGAKIDPARFKQPAGFQYGGDRAVLLAEGERLWNDRSLGNSGIACSTCHVGNYGQMHPSFAEPYPHRVAMPHQRAGVSEVTAAEMVNFCMLVPMNDDPLAWNSPELAALATYVEDIQEGYEIAAANPCNPCGGQANPCNPCGGETNPCNPCSGKSNPCNPCDGKPNPCNPCGGQPNPCNPCGGAKS